MSSLFLLSKLVGASTEITLFRTTKFSADKDTGVELR